MLMLDQQRMAAVPKRHCGRSWFIGVEVRGRAGQDVAASTLFISRVVYEEVLQQPWRCLAWERGSAGDVVGIAKDSPGAIAGIVYAQVTRGMAKSWVELEKEAS